MNEENRKPIIAVVVLGIIAVLVLVFGVSCGGDNDDAAADWQGSFAGAAQGGRLLGGDLVPAGGPCSASGSQLVVKGNCVFEVKEFGGLFNFGPPTKRAGLVPLQPVTVALHMEGTRTEQDVSPGDRMDLTFGTSGGRLSVACAVVGNCVLQLLEAGG